MIFVCYEDGYCEDGDHGFIEVNDICEAMRFIQGRLAEDTKRNLTMYNVIEGVKVQLEGIEVVEEEVEETGLLTYDQLPQGIDITSIEVSSEQDREQVLLAIKYLHDRRDIDTNLAAVNSLVHMYHVPDRIVVKP